MSNTLPASFKLKKEKILSLLAVPVTDYDDLSPKGSVDVQIRDLIDEINAQDGWVTTSSCSGRISIYLDGVKIGVKPAVVEVDDASMEGGAGERAGNAKAGGKGGGRWLFVSHDPVTALDESMSSYAELCGLKGCDGKEVQVDSHSRLVHLKFEPMILHVLTASSAHAQSILSAALQAGFRESGALNIMPLVGSNDVVTPMVGIRSMGLALESIIGVEIDGETLSLVPEWQLKALFEIGNQRFVENSRRIQRFRESLQAGIQRSDDKLGRRKGQEGDEWEDKDARRARKAEEGKRKAEEIRRARQEQATCNPPDNILLDNNLIDNETI